MTRGTLCALFDKYDINTVFLGDYKKATSSEDEIAILNLSRFLNNPFRMPGIDKKELRLFLEENGVDIDKRYGTFLVTCKYCYNSFCRQEACGNIRVFNAPERNINNISVCYQDPMFVKKHITIGLHIDIEYEVLDGHFKIIKIFDWVPSSKIEKKEGKERKEESEVSVKSDPKKYNSTYRKVLENTYRMSF